MSKSNKYITGLIALVMTIGLGMYLNRRHMETSTPALDSAPTAQTTNRPIVHAQRPAAVAEMPGENNRARLPREKVEAYLRRHNRNAASLLAAFCVLQDTNYLKEAATNFPNDPHVQWTVVARNAFPEDRRKWLDNFKGSSPSNSVANYLSAEDYFNRNQPDAAMKELVAAAGKSQFSDYVMESILDEEDLYRFSGSSATETRVAAIADMDVELLHQLVQFKGVAIGLRDLQHQYANSGDAASVQALAQMGLDLANRFTTGDDGKFDISDSVGVGVKAIVMESLDQNTGYDFLGGETPAQRLAELKQERASFRDLRKAVSSAVGLATDDQMNAYWERMKIYGQPSAMRWLVQQTTVGSNGGN